MPDAFHVCLLGANAVILCLAALFANRACRAARHARACERLAWLSERNAARHADRVDAMLPPDVIPFPVEVERPAINSADFLGGPAGPTGPRLSRPPEDDPCCS